MQTKIKQFIRYKNREKIGVMVAKKVGDSVKISWSLCNKMDYFDPKFGESMAEARIDVNRCPNIPSSIVDQLENFKKRSEIYFVGCHVYFVNSKINDNTLEKSMISSYNEILERVMPREKYSNSHLYNTKSIVVREH